ncbi:winged helix DNA-binding domain-containing protein [Mrakia frigida]|uniref:La RNA-binding domain-containing protein n=1 Tax=Mrakia frigida TaxID=29902 RepID=UPI003FCC1777
MPVTVPSFPLDPLRFYLLGQLEYYFGVQNLAMDFFLRQQMDTLGFVSIPLIATFNRVKNLTSDLTIVREMMALSSIFEVRGDKVRLSNRGWEQWTLPGAVQSEEEDVVEGAEEERELTQDEKDEREVEEATLSI